MVPLKGCSRTGDSFSTRRLFMGAQLYQRLSFGEHLRIATVEAIQFGDNLARLMPIIGGSREAKRRLVASMVHSKLLYATPFLASALNNHAIQKNLSSAQRSMDME